MPRKFSKLSFLVAFSFATCTFLFFPSCTEKKKDSQSVEISTSKEDSQIENKQDKKATSLEEGLYEVFSEWIAGQNNGDFQRYKKGYASPFNGIKRAGTKTTRYNLDDWLVDRKRMFRKPMTVEANDIKIIHTKRPYKIKFEQTWSNGTFSDVGMKVLLFDSIDGTLRIISEEMLNSNLIAAKKDANNALNHPKFFLRSQENLLVKRDFTPNKLNKTTQSCNLYDGTEICVDVHEYLVDSYLLDIDDQDLLGQHVFFGNIEDSILSDATVKQFKVLNEEVRESDSLAGISVEGSIFEQSYYWTGNGHHTVLECMKDSTENYTGTQWAFVAKQEPIVYTKREASSEEWTLLKSIAPDINLNSYEATVFINGSDSYLVSYSGESECGELQYYNFKLYSIKEDQLLFIRELPDLPVTIFDLDRDGDMDILYWEETRDDPDSFIEIEYPRFYEGGNGDTIFAGCGC